MDRMGKYDWKSCGKINHHVVMQYTAVIFLFVFLFSFLTYHNAVAQSITSDEFVTYSKQSAYVKEIPFPSKDFGLRGIVTDNEGNVWIYHSTQNTSFISKYNPISQSFTRFDISQSTNTKDVIVNLSGGSIIYDQLRNAIWFTDARTNSIGRFDIDNNQMSVINIPTENSGPMGLILSPDKSKIWFTELNSDKFASLDIKTDKIKEYQIKDNSGPALLAFDAEGNLWITLSYSNRILKIGLQDIDADTFPRISEIKLPPPDFFSPFGIAITNHNDAQKIYLSDHGSSRVIVAEIDSNLKKYSSLWTSEAQYPQTLPSQIDADRKGNVYFAQHGGNKLSKIDNSGVVTEYDIPTGPLSTAIYIDATDDGKKVWFTEVLSNKIGYLDMNIPIPFDIQINKDEIFFTKDKASEKVTLTVKNSGSNLGHVSLENMDISLVGMTHSGLDGISITANPSEINMKQKNAKSIIDINIDQNTKSGTYHVMLRVSASETADKSVMVSKLYPLTIIADFPKDATAESLNTDVKTESEFTIKDIIQYSAIIVIIVLISLLIYHKIRTYKQKTTQQNYFF